MKRVKRHKIKKEMPEGASTHLREHEEHDLAFYIHDRVELMHQVFSMLKYKELKAMAPDCVRNLAIGDLQELCTEELLGISSKRLLAILDGAEPPSDTESSSPSPPPDQLETISLDSISSDEELLSSSHNKKKKHKHHRRNSKSKSKKKDKLKEPKADENAEVSKASRAGLTVLELLELQARARAIRAQLQQEQAHKHPKETTTVESSHHSSDNEVEIKEEPPDVVEISSEDEKPDVNQLKKNIADMPSSPKLVDGVDTQEDKEIDKQDNPQNVTKRVNDLIITVPQAKSNRKIKLNRNKVTVSVLNEPEKNENSTSAEPCNISIVEKSIADKVVDNYKTLAEKSKETKGKKKKKGKKKSRAEKDGSDHDEITLQLSDSEKMDLLEDLDESRKNYDKVSSSSEDNDSSNSNSEEENNTKGISIKQKYSPAETAPASFTGVLEKNSGSDNNSENMEVNDSCSHKKNNDLIERQISKEKTSETSSNNTNENVNKENVNSDNRQYSSEEQKTKSVETIDSGNDLNITKDNDLQNDIIDSAMAQSTIVDKTFDNEIITNVVVERSVEKEKYLPNKDNSPKLIVNKDNVIEIRTIDDFTLLTNDATNNTLNKSPTSSEKDIEQLKKGHVTNDREALSDGEISDRESSEVEAVDLRPEVVCISDEDNPKSNDTKKKKKKVKKSKKEKKTKKSKSDFRDDADQNFYKEVAHMIDDTNRQNDFASPSEKLPIDLDSDDVYEILELSDDSSCYEVEGTVLSKEPTAEEIEALSVKIDEIKREEVVTDEQILEYEQNMMAAKEISKQPEENVENVSWRDRYLDSNKVKKVLTTANIFNALRKKNKELKKKIAESKKNDEESKANEETVPIAINVSLEEGSIEHYNTLQTLTKYVDPVKEPINEIKDDERNECEKTICKMNEENISNEMKKDAKQLLKMYRRLLKYNDMTKQTDSSKKKKKKQKKRDKHDCSNTSKASKNTSI